MLKLTGLGLDIVLSLQGQGKVLYQAHLGIALSLQG